MVLVVIGKNACGKSTFSSYVAIKYNYVVYEIGDFVREAYSRIDKNISITNYTHWLYKSGNLINFLKKAVELSKSEDNKNIIFCGIRTTEEIVLLRELYKNIRIILIECKDDIRNQRYYKHLIDNISIEARDSSENMWCKDLWDKENADFVIYNNESIESFYKRISQLFDSL